MDFGDRLAMLIDIGGGSVEVTVATQDVILLTESYKMGSVRLIGKFHEDGKEFDRIVVDHIDATRRRIEREIGQREIECCFGTGGSIESLGELRRTLYGRSSSTKLGADELARLVKDPGSPDERATHRRARAAGRPGGCDRTGRGSS